MISLVFVWLLLPALAYAAPLTMERMPVGAKVKLHETGAPILSENGQSFRYHEANGQARPTITTPRTTRQ